MNMKKTKTNDVKSRTGSSSGFFLKNGQYFAKPSKKTQKKTYNQPKKFMATSTYRDSFKPLTTKKGKKPLVPYSENCPRRAHYKSEYKPGKKTNKSNESHITLGNPKNDRTRFRTTNKLTYNEQMTQIPSGFSNQAIISQKTKWAHKRILD